MLKITGAVTVNNSLVLGLLLYSVWRNQLDWVYSSEVTVIVIPTVVFGALTFRKHQFPAFVAAPALALWPASLLTVYLLDTYLGWQ